MLRQVKYSEVTVFSSKYGKIIFTDKWYSDQAIDQAWQQHF